MAVRRPKESQQLPGEQLTRKLCLLQAQLFYPLSNLSAISTYLDELGDELNRRLKAANVTGGMAALDMLNKFLFAQNDK